MFPPFPPVLKLNNMRDTTKSLKRLFLFGSVNRAPQHRALPVAARVAVVGLAWEIAWRGTGGFF